MHKLSSWLLRILGSTCVSC